MRSTPRRARSCAASMLLAGAVAACATVTQDTPTCFETGCAHGNCELVGASAQCVCFPRWMGATCDECALGYVDLEHEGVCGPGCDPRVCNGESERCSAGTPSTCECIERYARPVEGGACVFVGGPRDPDFESPDAWSVSGSVAVVPGEVPGAFGSGFAVFSGSGEVHQSFEMPAFADPVAASLHLECPGFCGPELSSTVSVTFDGRPKDIPFHGQGRISFCLGERAFGRHLRLGARTYASGPVLVPSAGVLLDRLTFEPGPGCPAPGTVTDGDFETTSSSTADVVELPGGNHVARGMSACDFESWVVSTSISVPENLPDAALAFTVSSDDPGTHAVRVRLGNLVIGSATATRGQRRAVVCLPEWARGFAADLTITAQRADDCSGRNQSLELDDLAVVRSPGCADGTDVGTFEGDLRWWTGWHASFVQGATDAHSGSQYVRLRATCGSPTRFETTYLTVPDHVDGVSGGPAVKLWYRTTGFTKSAAAALRTISLRPDQRFLDPTDGGWQEATACLHPEAWGHAATIALELTGLDCGATQLLDLDDVTVGPDPSCPAE